MDGLYERKKSKYSVIIDEAKQQGWNASLLPVEVGYRRFIAKSTVRFLKQCGIHRQGLWKAIRDVSNTAQRSSS